MWQCVTFNDGKKKTENRQHVSKTGLVYLADIKPLKRRQREGGREKGHTVWPNQGHRTNEEEDRRITNTHRHQNTNTRMYNDVYQQKKHHTRHGGNTECVNKCRTVSGYNIARQENDSPVRTQ